MKLFMKSLLALTLVCCLLAALGGSAYADTRTITVNATVGKEFEFSETIKGELKSMSIRGECPGLTFGTVTDGFKIFGTPTTAGSYALETSVEKAGGGTDTYIVNIVVRNEGDNGGGQAAVVVPDDKPVNDGKVAVTKHPTGEQVKVGDTALFVARAVNAETFNWGLYNAATDEYFTAAQAQGNFAGLVVEVTGDAGDTTLRLSNIPYSLNGWLVEARFFGSDKENRAFSNGARITVTGDTLPTPKISADPVGASLERGKTTTLSVTAASDAGAKTLRYQWYKSDTDKNTGGTAITGATSSSYTPPESSGTTYYYVNVWSTDGTKESTHVNSKAVAVTYPAAPTPTQAPAGQTDAGGQTGTQIAPDGGQTGFTPAANTGGQAEGGDQPQNGSQASAVVITEPSAAPVSAQRSHTGVVVLILVLAAVLLAACATLFVLKRTGRD